MKMHIHLPEDIVQLRDTVRRFVATEVEPRAAEIDRTNTIPTAIFDTARELGLFGLSIPEEFGGLGECELASCVALETLSRGPGGVTFYVAPNAPAAAIRHAGTPKQKAEYLEPLAEGRKFAAFCLTEEGAGSDAAGIRTRAVKRGDTWMINGTKMWVSRAADAEVFLVSAVTDPERKPKPGITIFLIGRRPGLSTGAPDVQMGGRGSGSAEVRFEDVEAGEDEILGELHDGFGGLKFVLGRARLWAAARAVGVIGKAAELSIDHSRTRRQFGQPIGEFQMVKEKIANMVADLYAARLQLYQAASLFDQGIDAAQEAAYAKLFASEAAGRATDACVQIHGAMGVAVGFAAERLYRDCRSYRILDGTSDIQRLMIASRVQKRGLGESIAPGGVA
ncbi:acyl-CoA dehydrogenase family protein [Cereibacter azotoformans]|uniref:acyl-CoA dehydrogenase family protein n=1 Tax=Cereibacter azotoformans TaxID=43057 RepID=UPI000C6E3432|nr:acyl-CoA dehydrogenase family protein [Cereibacter azotoformans]